MASVHRWSTPLSALLVITALLSACSQAPAREAQSTRPPRQGMVSAAPVESVVRAAPPTAIPTQPPTSTPLSTPRPIAVIVENSPEARPQSGLDKADLIYEAMAEGGISRFMAVYSRNEPRVVGPVRSARHYFASFAADLGAPLVHFGSSPQGYDQIAALKLPSLDGIQGGEAFWRDPKRAAPHNAYANLALARTSLSPLTPGGRLPSILGSVDRAAPAANDTPVRSVTISFRPWRYRAGFTYDAADRSYLRLTDGEIHRDAQSNEALRAGAILILTVPATIIDSAGRLDLAIQGQGPITVVSQGTARHGRWLKRSAGEPMQFQTVAGVPFGLARGPVWIEVVQPETVVELSP